MMVAIRAQVLTEIGTGEAAFAFASCKTATSSERLV